MRSMIRVVQAHKTDGEDSMRTSCLFLCSSGKQPTPEPVFAGRLLFFALTPDTTTYTSVLTSSVVQCFMAILPTGRSTATPRVILPIPSMRDHSPSDMEDKSSPLHNDTRGQPDE
ncbi:hypothetical protein PG990_006558 [Apiospora arundinis]|uniref:Uncharacterized protein n=1 Tax=Apiospora arundinis TaxID=335852 RepID=A0ABR2JAJ5_9PEZI